ncbi:hypothetical protein FPF71_05385 [Algibacter amylolyticus]|uniref:Uncharacterized protein n=1 Tax=Algibacter amylolyticus TaxID=1608400 RepID=A0A5M7BD23_9FLAO|nr:hypothetical protein [Algibacter amylolyticus]KAA5826248.1 hypothetical protein F2B50_05385 [Algibacter amylolyticus]MBB5268451.1 hypothetical protein [Algibacter amylolyticus]TSJ80286.1 hypothetical protein FPF71_05385 [Algibacter amylolyticus]
MAEIHKKEQVFTRNQLYNLVWSTPVSKILEEYAISNTGFKNLCKKHDVPLPPNGHWQKLKHNKEVNVIPLSSSDKNFDNITLPKRLEGEESLNNVSELNLLIREIKNDKNLPLTVPDKLNKPVKEVISTKKHLKLTRKAKWPYDVDEPKDGVLSLAVSDDLVERGLIFGDTFIKLLRCRGHEVKNIRNHKYSNYNGLRYIIHGEYFVLRLREIDKRVMEKSEYSWQTAKYYPTGKLCLKDENYPRHEWTDVKTIKLEDRLAAIVAYLEISAKRKTKERIENEIRWAENERRRKIEEELKQRREKDLNQFKAVISNSSRWQKSMDLRNYILAVEKNARERNQFTDELKNWLQWIKDKADWYDPLIEKEDELFKGIDRDSI